MRIAICDDDKSCNEKLRQMLRKYRRDNEIRNMEITEYTSGIALLEEYKFEMYDFIFLDLQMPDQHGSEIAESLRKIDWKVSIVFVTNDPSFMQKGYDYGIKKYLVKEITQKQIDNVMDGMIKDRLLGNKGKLFKIKVKKENTTVFVPLSKIMYFESDGHEIGAKLDIEPYIYVFLGKIKQLVTDLEEEGFVRINKSVVVNIEYVFKIFNGDMVVIKKGKSFKLSPNYKQGILNAFQLRENSKWKI